MNLRQLHDHLTQTLHPSAIAAVAGVPVVRWSRCVSGLMRLPASALCRLLDAGHITPEQAADVWVSLMTADEVRLSRIVTRRGGEI